MMRHRTVDRYSRSSSRVSEPTVYAEGGAAQGGPLSRCSVSGSPYENGGPLKGRRCGTSFIGYPASIAVVRILPIAIVAGLPMLPFMLSHNLRISISMLAPKFSVQAPILITTNTLIVCLLVRFFDRFMFVFMLVRQVAVLTIMAVVISVIAAIRVVTVPAIAITGVISARADRDRHLAARICGRWYHCHGSSQAYEG